MSGRTRAAGPSSIGAPPPRDLVAGAATAKDRSSNAPVIVLAPRYFGADLISAMLDGRPELACTAGTGLLPLSEQALATWRKADRRVTGEPSSLAISSTRIRQLLKAGRSIRGLVPDAVIQTFTTEDVRALTHDEDPAQD